MIPKHSKTQPSTFPDPPKSTPGEALGPKIHPRGASDQPRDAQEQPRSAQDWILEALGRVLGDQNG